MFCPIVDLAKELISIPSVSPCDLGCQKIIIKRLRKLGFNIVDLQCRNTSNFFAYLGNCGVNLAFAGHTDVVQPGNLKLWNYHPFQPVIKNGYIFGRGSVDMKGSIAAMIVAAERFVLCYPKFKGILSFLITSDEESEAKDGTKYIVKYLKLINKKIEYCIIGEPTSDNFLGDTIKIGRRGSLHADLLIYGVQGHIAYPCFASNPIHNSLAFLKELVDKKWDKGNKYFSSTSMQISKIISNTDSENIIPGILQIKFNFRFGSSISIEEIKNAVYLLLKFYKLKYSIKWKLSGYPFINNQNYLISLVKRSIEEINGINSNLSTSGGTSDGRFIKDICSELIELGPINSMIHKINECVKIHDLQILSKIYEGIMKKILIQ